MKIIKYSEFRTSLDEILNAVTGTKEILVVSRRKGKSVIIMDLNEYNAIMETTHLTSTKANRKRLYEAIEEMRNGYGC